MIVDDNILLRNSSGRLGNMILRQRFGKTVAYSRPVSKTGWKPTPGQQINRDQFRNAHEYAINALLDGPLRQFYVSQAKLAPAQSAYNIAVRDARKAPRIESLDTAGYKGHVNDPVLIRAKDDTLVTYVLVSIFSAEGFLIEEGNAEIQNNLDTWVYHVRQANEIPEGCIIRAIAQDKPGNKAVMEAVS